MAIKLAAWRSTTNNYERVFVNGLPVTGKVWLVWKSNGLAVEFERGVTGVDVNDVLAAAEELAGGPPSSWREFYLAVENQPKATRGSKPGTKASSRRTSGVSEYTAIDMEDIAVDIKTHPLTQPVTIYVDDREPGEMVDMLRSVRNLTVEVATLETGDYVVEGKLIIERKTIADFVTSVSGKRLFLQAERIGELGVRGVLLIEGNIYQQTNMTLESITGALSWLTIQGISIIHTVSMKHSAHLIAKLTRHAVEGLGYEIPYRTLGPKDPSGAAAFVIEGIPDISTALSKQLLKSFGSVARLCQAEMPDLLAVPGIGPSKAKKIYETLRAGPSPE
jgi:Fanconi anemia group M protein